MIVKRVPNMAPDYSHKPNFGHKVRQAREECGLSQRELGEILGYDSQTALSLIERNERQVSARTLWTISQVTKLPISWFYNEPPHQKYSQEEV